MNLLMNSLSAWLKWCRGWCRCGPTGDLIVG